MEILDEIRNRHDFCLIGYVVMPEHVHLLLSEAKNLDPSKVLQVLKQRVSLELHERKQQRTMLSSTAADEAAFWYRRFHDFNVWSEAKIREKLDYMHANPIKRGLVNASKKLAVEQLVTLCDGRSGFDPDRSAAIEDR